MLDPSPNSLVHGESLEIRDYQLCAIWKNLGYSEWSTPAGLKLARENLQSRVKEEDSITDVENAVFDLGVMDSLCFLFIDQRVFIGMITKRGHNRRRSDLRNLQNNSGKSLVGRAFVQPILIKVIDGLRGVSVGRLWSYCCPRDAPTAKSLASPHDFKWARSNSGATRIGAFLGLTSSISDFKIASMHFLRRQIKRSFLFKDVGHRPGDFGKSHLNKSSALESGRDEKHCDNTLNCSWMRAILHDNQLFALSTSIP
ncbi:hypothetical protein Tco_0260803 [Tanacetum coccineum]